MEENYNFSDFSDSEDDASDFKNTIAAIRKLDNHKQVLPAERSEPSLKVDEFHLTKEGDTSAVKLSELTRTLSQQPKHSKIAHDLKVAQKRTKTLPKPLERPEAERVSRSVGFEKVKNQLNLWDPIVKQNRLAEHQVFPLPSHEDSVTTAHELTATIVPETDLEKRMAEILKKNNPNPEEIEDGSSIFQLTLEEMVEKRKEAARLRAQQSYILAKARRQNKIKSKTYHRIARRERVRQQMKEFETLQQTNPEEALKRLEELEKERALERVSLRHRNTGKWAKNQAVRAKYNKESREVLSEQLKLSRDLTKKVPVDSESSGEDNDDNEQNLETDNPWVGGGTKTEAEIDDFISGYRKFWDAKQKGEEEEKVEEVDEAKREAEAEAMEERAQGLLKSAVVAASASVLEVDDLSSDDADGVPTREVEGERNGASSRAPLKKAETISPAVKPKVVESKESSDKNSPNASLKPVAKQLKDSAANKRKTDEAEASRKKKRPSMPDATSKPDHSKIIPNGISEVPPKSLVNGQKQKVMFVKSKSGKWTVTAKKEQKPVEKKVDLKERRREINIMINKMDSILQKKAENKINKLKKSLDQEEYTKKKTKRKPKAEKANKSVVSSLRGNRHQRPDEDEGLDERSGNRSSIAEKNVNVPDLVDHGETGALPEIDPNNFMKTVRTQLQNAVPDLLANGDEGMDDEEADGNNHLTISEAFADDDVVAEFEQEKSEEVESNKPKDIDLSLPGWGSWGGHKIKPNERRSKRFIIKAPEPVKRRDENKGNVYINEKEESKLKPQQVTELPFPFNNVKDFESSVGAPISNTFVPESAHRKLVLPKVITRTGTIIKPLSKDVLTQRKKERQRMKTVEGKKAGKS